MKKKKITKLLNTFENIKNYAVSVFENQHQNATAQIKKLMNTYDIRDVNKSDFDNMVWRYLVAKQILREVDHPIIKSPSIDQIRAKAVLYIQEHKELWDEIRKMRAQAQIETTLKH